MALKNRFIPCVQGAFVERELDHPESDGAVAVEGRFPAPFMTEKCR